MVWPGWDGARGAAAGASPFVGLSSFRYRCLNHPDWPIVFVTPSVVDVVGVAHDALLDRRVDFGALIHEDDRLAVWSEVQDAIRQGRRFRMLYRVRHADGAWLWVAEEGQLAGRAGEESYLEGEIWDISAHQRVKEQYSHALRLEGLGRISARLAADLNNVMTVVHGTATLIAQAHGAPPPEVVQSLLRAAEAGAALSRRVVLLAGDDALAPRPMEIDPWLESSLPFFARVLGEGRALSLQTAAAGCVLHVDPRLLDQVLLNLLTNAAEAMGEGGQCRVSTRLLAHDARRRLVEIEVADDGVGMSEEVLARAFHPYFTTRAAERATGLGLSIVHAIARQAGGEVQLRSELGRGTIVSVRLPLLPGTE